MSAVFDLDTEGQASLAESARTNGISIDQMQSGLWQGIPKAIGMGVLRGGARTAQAAALAATAPLVAYEDLTGQPGKYSDVAFKAIDDNLSSAVDFWTPGVNEVGWAGRILGGFSEMALPLMLGAGNPVPLIGTTELTGAQDLAKQGVSPAASVAVGAIQGLATAAGFRIPFLGKTLGSRLASGIAGNLAINAGSEAAAQQVLKRTGNEQAAGQFDPMNLEARLVDVLTGAAFGGIAHLSMRDAAATAVNARHFQEDTAPGVPANIASSIAHQKALETAIHDTLEGRPVDVSNTGVTQAEFIPLPKPFGHLSEMPELKGVDESARLPAEIASVPEAAQLIHQEKAVEAGTPPQEPILADLKSVPHTAEEPLAAPETARLKEAAPADSIAQANDAIDLVQRQTAGQSGEQKTAGQAAPPAGTAKAVDPLVVTARQAVAAHDFQIPTGELDAAGHPVTRSAREVLAEADAAVVQAQHDAKAFDALVGCILTRGT